MAGAGAEARRGLRRVSWRTVETPRNGGAELTATVQSAGVRLSLPDRRPLADWHPQRRWLGFCGAPGSKGTLWAPWLARGWQEALLARAEEFPAETG